MLHDLFRSNDLLSTILALMLLFLSGSMAKAQTLPSFVFKQATIVREWQPTCDLANIQATSQDMLIAIRGNDPYTIGPARAYPRDPTLRLCIHLLTDVGSFGAERDHGLFNRLELGKVRTTFFPPLSYADQMFDCIYTISVFTHLSAEIQTLWLRGLGHILKPDGRLLVTTFGEC